MGPADLAGPLRVMANHNASGVVGRLAAPPRLTGYHGHMSIPLPDSSVPRLLGFDVPTLQTIVDHGADEAIVAMLDVAPDAHWLKLFDERVAALQGELGLAGVELDGTSILFFGSIADSRRLATAISALINGINMEVAGHNAPLHPPAP